MRKFAIVLLVLAACGGGQSAQSAKPKPQPRIGTPGPLALTFDARALMVGDRDLRRVLRIDLRTRKRTVVASGFPEAIVGIGYDDMNRLYVSSGDRVYRIEGRRKVVVAGTGARGHTGDGGPATAATLAGAGGIDVDHDEEIAIAEYDNWVRVVGADGVIRSAAGNGGTGYDGDGGRATAALLGHPHDVIWRRDKVLLIADSHNGAIRRVDGEGRITTFARGFVAPVLIEGGAGDRIFVADGRLQSIYRLEADGSGRVEVASADGPVGLAVDGNDNVYVSELNGRRRVLRVTPAGRVTVLARR